MRKLKTAILGLGIWAVQGAAADAAMLTVGPALPGPYGSNMCADVELNSLTPGTKIQTYSCFGAGNQQFMFYARTIYALSMQRCWEATSLTIGARVVSAVCNASKHEQQWQYTNGYIRNWWSALCIQGGVGHTALTLQQCVKIADQQWQIK